MYAVKSKLLAQSSVRRLLQVATKSTAAAEPFLNGSSSTYVEEMYESWKADASSVHKVSFTFLALLQRHSVSEICILKVEWLRW